MRSAKTPFDGTFQLLRGFVLFDRIAPEILQQQQVEMFQHLSLEKFGIHVI